jgi:ketosteroid isomerase-like protein
VEPATDHNEDDDLVETYRAYLRAMTDGDTAALRELLADGFTLTHISGYVQSKTRWLLEMRAGKFRYHNVEEETVKVEVTGNTAQVVGLITTDAMVHGTRADWRLRLSMDYYDGCRWVALRSVATSW